MEMGFQERSRFKVDSLRRGRRCRRCNHHLKAGTPALIVMGVEKKFYPVRGIMGFRRSLAFCVSCEPTTNS